MRYALYSGTCNNSRYELFNIICIILQNVHRPIYDKVIILYSTQGNYVQTMPCQITELPYKYLSKRRKFLMEMCSILVQCIIESRCILLCESAEYSTGSCYCGWR